jgi:hypothetical protein
MSRRARRGWQTLAVGAALLALLAVFGAYLDPHLMADLANRVWACF